MLSMHVSRREDYLLGHQVTRGKKHRFGDVGILFSSFLNYGTLLAHIKVSRRIVVEFSIIKQAVVFRENPNSRPRPKHTPK